MKIIVREEYIIPQSPAGKKCADEISDFLLLHDAFQDRKEDTVNIFVSAKYTFDLNYAERKEE